jgi:RNA polymerase sigma-70 factor (ECF subfamily)
MADTSASLLARLHDRDDQAAWQRLVDLYAPLIQHWLHRASLQPSDVEDLSQDVLAVVIRKVVQFEHDGRPGSFRAWLKAITVNRLRDYWRSRGTHGQASGDSAVARLLEELQDPDSSISRIWDQDHDQYILRRLLELIEPAFKPTTWQAFCRHVLNGEAVDAVAQALNLSPNAVFIAKSRVLQRLREEARGLIDDSSLGF